VSAEQQREPVGIIYVECGLVVIDNGDGWQAYLTDVEPAEVATYCPGCAEREFKQN
jgi:hypothetical protein